ncbi:MAG: aldose 1-epimerase family protein [Vallitaleaceae bacterium]|nr:aldose 1-epimerase family protein [Vallitaleaceae bacterium]
MARYVLKNEELELGFESRGAQLYSVNGRDRDYLWNGDPQHWPWHSPILFPFVGRAKNFEYRYEEKVYTMKQHGFAREKEFRLLFQSENEISFSLLWDEESYSVYPFKFELILGYELVENQIVVKWKVRNLDDKIIHFSIGGHPAFYCPLSGFGEREDYYLNFYQEQIQYQLLTKDGLLHRELYSLPLYQGKYRITEDLFDLDALIFTQEGSKRLSLCTPDQKPYVSLIFDAPVYGIYSPKKKAPFVCIEPWYGRCDAIDFEGELSEREFGQSLAIGAEFVGGYTMEFC